MGLTLSDDVDVALERFMLMHNFLLQAKKETIKLTSEDKYLRKNSKKLNTSLANIQKNTKLFRENKIQKTYWRKKWELVNRLCLVLQQL